MGPAAVPLAQTDGTASTDGQPSPGWLDSITPYLELHSTTGKRALALKLPMDEVCDCVSGLCMIVSLNVRFVGSAGFVAINSGSTAWTKQFTTSLPAGNYCDVTTGKVSSGACTGLKSVDLFLPGLNFADIFCT